MTAAAKPDSKDTRAERLAVALRENHTRRKAQARAKEQTKNSKKEPGRAAG
jgi:hypothetical protein